MITKPEKILEINSKDKFSTSANNIISHHNLKTESGEHEISEYEIIGNVDPKAGKFVVPCKHVCDRAGCGEKCTKALKLLKLPKCENQFYFIKSSLDGLEK